MARKSQKRDLSHRTNKTNPDMDRPPIPQSAPSAAQMNSQASRIQITQGQPDSGPAMSVESATASPAPLSKPTGEEPRPEGASGMENLGPNFSAANQGEDQNQKAGNRGLGAGDLGSHRMRSHDGMDDFTPVGDVMTANVECCTPDTQLYYIARMMADRDCGAIPVVENTESMRPIGMVTDRDIVIRVIAKNEDPYSMRAGDVMSTNILCISRDTRVRDCIRQMEARQVRRVPVVDSSGRLCGIVAQADIATTSSEDMAGELVERLSEPGDSQNIYH